MFQLKQCAQMLGYTKGQVLELFKSTLHTWYYYLLFSIQNPREAVESAKKVMTKENGQKISRSKLHLIHVPSNTPLYKEQKNQVWWI